MTMKKKVWIFGDSYSDPVNYRRNNHQTWPIELGKKYDVCNFSHQGSSPDWSLELLDKEIKSHDVNDLKDISLIFLKSDPYRFNFSFFDTPEDHALLMHLDKIDRSDNQKKIEKYSKYLNFYKDFLKYYAYKNNYHDIASMKIVGSLKLYEAFFEKILVWPIFNTLKYPVLQTDKFYYVDKILYDVENKKYAFGQDYRSNHLSKENHEIMLEQLSNWIEYKTPIDASKFIYNVDRQ